jgi:hypothetical protein
LRAGLGCTAEPTQTHSTKPDPARPISTPNNKVKLVRLLKACNEQEARAEAKAMKRAEIDERKRVKSIAVAEKKHIVETRRVESKAVCPGSIRVD